MLDEYHVIWSIESSKKIQSIKGYILDEWNEKEVNNFLKKLKEFENIVVRFPKLYPSSLKDTKLRKAVISKHQTVLYEMDNDIIRVHTILDNRQQS